MEPVKYLVGVDEVGRGPIAGPVTVCAFSVKNKKSVLRVLKNLLEYDKSGLLKDSKKLSAKQREACFAKIKEERSDKIEPELDFAVSCVGNWFIDRYGIVKAVNLAIKRSLDKLGLEPKKVKIFLDGGLKAPKEFLFQETIIKGDQKIPVIALSSIVAKVHRDKLMNRMAKKFQGYGFENHVGYGTAYHYRAIKKFGLCDVHRKSYIKIFV